jgi:PAS domain S-box-containing protein
MNPIAELLTGWSMDEARGRPIAAVFRIVHATSRVPVVSPVEVVLRDGIIAGLASQTQLVRRDGGEVAVDDSAAPIRDDAGAITGVVLVFRDSSNVRRVEAERERLHAEAQMRSDFERQLIGIVSHDLRGPLGTIKLGAELLAGNPYLDDKARRVVGRIRNGADQGTRMVGDLLDFTKARLGGGIPIVREHGDLHGLVRQVCEEIGAAHPDRPVAVTTSGDGHGRWDLDRLTQVVENLLRNAITHGTARSTISVTSHGDDAGVTVSVGNVGAPIEAAAMERIFQPLQRATADLAITTRSVGLGLFIVKHVVEGHGGRVDVASTAEEGTTFSFWLPRSEPSSAP